MNIYLEYTGYLCEAIVDIWRDGMPDMTATVMHLESTGYLEPIYESGLGPRYRVTIVDVPDWLITGIRRGMTDGRWSDGHTAEYWATYYAINGYPRGWDGALRPLIAKTGKFADSVRLFFATHGYITDKQARYIR